MVDGGENDHDVDNFLHHSQHGTSIYKLMFGEDTINTDDGTVKIRIQNILSSWAGWFSDEKEWFAETSDELHDESRRKALKVNVYLLLRKIIEIIGSLAAKRGEDKPIVKVIENSLFVVHLQTCMTAQKQK